MEVDANEKETGKTEQTGTNEDRIHCKREMTVSRDESNER